jgi:hypothetical protein
VAESPPSGRPSLPSRTLFLPPREDAASTTNTPREQRSGRRRPHANKYPSYGRRLGASQATIASAEASSRQTEARSPHHTGWNAMGLGQRRLVEGSARERVRSLANGLRSLPQMAPRRALAEHNGGTRPMTERGSVAVGLETVWKVLGGRDGGLRSTPWRAEDTPRICQTTNGVASTHIFPSPQDKDAPGFTA